MVSSAKPMAAAEDLKARNFEIMMIPPSQQRGYKDIEHDKHNPKRSPPQRISGSRKLKTADSKSSLRREGSSMNPYSDSDKLHMDDDLMFKFGGGARDYTGTTLNLSHDPDEHSAITMDHFPAEEGHHHDSHPANLFPIESEDEPSEMSMPASVHSTLDMLHSRLALFTRSKKSLRNVAEAKEAIRMLEQHLQEAIHVKLQEVEEEANVTADIEELQGIATEISGENDELVSDIQDLLEENEVLLEDMQLCQNDTSFLTERLSTLERERDDLAAKLDAAEEEKKRRQSFGPNVGGGTMNDAVSQLKTSMHRTLKEVAAEKGNLKETIEELRGELESTQDYMEKLLTERQKMTRRLKEMTQLVDKCHCALPGAGASVAESATTADWTLSSQTQSSSIEGTESSQRGHPSDAVKGWKESFIKHVGGKTEGLEKGTYAVLPGGDKGGGGVMKRLSRISQPQKADPYGMTDAQNPRRLSEGLALLMSRQAPDSPKSGQPRSRDEEPRKTEDLHALTRELAGAIRSGQTPQTRGSTGSIRFEPHSPSGTKRQQRPSLVQRCFTWNNTEEGPTNPLVAFPMESIRSCGTEESMSKAELDLAAAPRRKDKRGLEGSSSNLDDDESDYNGMFSVFGEDLSCHWTKPGDAAAAPAPNENPPEDNLEEPEQVRPPTKPDSKFEDVIQNAVGLIEHKKALDARQQEKLTRSGRRSSSTKGDTLFTKKEGSQRSLQRKSSKSMMKLPDHLPTPEEVFKAAKEKGRKEKEQQRGGANWLRRTNSGRDKMDVPVVEESLDGSVASIKSISDSEDIVTPMPGSKSRGEPRDLSPTGPKSAGRKKLAFKDRLPTNVKHSRWGSKVFK